MAELDDFRESQANGARGNAPMLTGSFSYSRPVANRLQLIRNLGFRGATCHGFGTSVVCRRQPHE